MKFVLMEVVLVMSVLVEATIMSISITVIDNVGGNMVQMVEVLRMMMVVIVMSMTVIIVVVVMILMTAILMVVVMIGIVLITMMGLTLLKVMDMVEVMREKCGVNELPIAMVMVPGMGVPRGVPKGGGGGTVGVAEVKAAEKTAFDVKLEGFDVAAKIKVIKEVRMFTSLGLKEAKDLVEKVPAVLKKGVTKEEVESIIAKMKEVGAKVLNIGRCLVVDSLQFPRSWSQTFFKTSNGFKLLSATTVLDVLTSLWRPHFPLRQQPPTMRYYSQFKHLSHFLKTLTRPQNPTFVSPRISQNPRPLPFHARECSSSSASQSQGSEKVAAIVDELMGLTLLEVMDLVEVMREKRGVNELPIAMLMVPGMGVPRGVPNGGGGGAAGVAEVKAVEKTVFDVKLEGFDAATKIKVIKEVRTFTSLGLKEAKDLVEKVPAMLKKGVTKEEAESIIAKMKEVGAKVLNIGRCLVADSSQLLILWSNAAAQIMVSDLFKTSNGLELLSATAVLDVLSSHIIMEATFSYNCVILVMAAHGDILYLVKDALENENEINVYFHHEVDPIPEEVPLMLDLKCHPIPEASNEDDLDDVPVVDHEEVTIDANVGGGEKGINVDVGGGEEKDVLAPIVDVPPIARYKLNMRRPKQKNIPDTLIVDVPVVDDPPSTSLLFMPTPRFTRRKAADKDPQRSTRDVPSLVIFETLVDVPSTRTDPQEMYPLLFLVKPKSQAVKPLILCEWGYKRILRREWEESKEFSDCGEGRHKRIQAVSPSFFWKREKRDIKRIQAVIAISIFECINQFNSESESSHMSTEAPKRDQWQWENATAGAAAGFATVAVMHPLDVVRTRFQVNDGRVSHLPIYKNTAHAVFAIARSEGLRGLYAGFLPGVLGSTISWGLYFFFYDRAKQRYARNREEKLSPGLHLASAAEAGALVSFFTNPVWLVKTRLQLQTPLHQTRPYSGVYDAFRTIMREEGFSALYKGIVPGLFLVSHGAIQFTAYEELRKVIVDFKSKGSTVHNQNPDKLLNSVDYAVLGATSKLAAVLLTYPFQQRPSGDGVPRYMDTLHVVKETARFEGIRGFYKGITANLLKNAPASSITFIVYENVLKLLKPARRND
ncbi:Folate transporter 1, chloroplastic [Glycine soja]